MNKEIKEILDYISDRIIPNEKWEAVKDYITNLNQENEKKDKIINEFEIWLSNEINFQKVVGRDWELRKVWFELQNIKENILTGGDE